MVRINGGTLIRLLGVGIAGLLLGAGVLAVPAQGAQDAPLLKVDARAQVPGSYVVVLKRGAKPAGSGWGAAARARRHGGTVRRQFGHALHGFSANLGAAALAAVRKDPDVAYVEPNGKARFAATQQDAPWGLDRVDQTGLPLSGTYSYGRDGTGVTAYLVDSGIWAENPDFGDRVQPMEDFVTDDTSGGEDCGGHGTRVAGILGGSTYGVAKGVTLVPLRIAACNGGVDSDAVLAALDRVVQDNVLKNHQGPAVVNISLEVSARQSWDDAVKAVIASGITVVVASGNDGQDACGISPALVPDAITVASSSSADNSWAGSNTGSCVDLYAPGVSVPTDRQEPGSSPKVTGTSMAAPHVAGAAALYLQANPLASAQQVQEALVAQASRDKLAGVPDGTPNALLYTPVDEPGPTLWLTRTVGDAVEVDSLTASSGYQAQGSVPSSYTASEAGSGVVQMVGDDQWLIKTRTSTSGQVEVSSSTGASLLGPPSESMATNLSANQAANGNWMMVGPDLWYVKLRATASGRVEVFSAPAASDYGDGVATRTAASTTLADSGTWQIADVTNDLWFVQTKGTASRKVEVSCYSAAKSYQSKCQPGLTSSLSLSEAANGTFQIVGTDLWFIKTRNTASGRVELSRATPASKFAFGRPTVTSWPVSDAAGQWRLS